jgi:uncharacterized protein (DUF2249 family)
MEMEPLTLDVRDDVRAGRDPFARIMDAVALLEPDQSLVLINVFEPVPLYGVMSARGFEHDTDRLPDGDWRVRFFRPRTAETAAETQALQ